MLLTNIHNFVECLPQGIATKVPPCILSLIHISWTLQANIHNFVVGLPQGYDTKVGGKGSQLSGTFRYESIYCRYSMGWIWFPVNVLSPSPSWDRLVYFKKSHIFKRIQILSVIEKNLKLHSLKTCVRDSRVSSEVESLKKRAVGCGTAQTHSSRNMTFITVFRRGF